MVKVVPVPTRVPPQLPVYHDHCVASFKVPEAVSVSVALGQTLFAEDVTIGWVGFEQAPTGASINPENAGAQPVLAVKSNLLVKVLVAKSYW